jgi:peptide chain release factor subunit 1
VGVITEDAVRELAKFKVDAAPVTSCYLDVDGRRLPTHQEVQRELDMVLRRARPVMNGDGNHPSVADDVARIERYVRGGFDRSGVRGLAMFSCSAAHWWEVHHLPVRVTSQIVVNSSPCVAQLERIVDDYERFGVLLADRQRARMLVFELGELVDHTEAFDPVVRQGADDRGELVKTRHGSQLAEQAQQHLRHTAALAFEVYQRYGFDRLIVGAPAEMVHELEGHLHPYLRERLVDHVNVGTQAADAQIRAAAHAVEEQVERRTEAEQIDRLRALVSTGGRAVAGLRDTLGALSAGRVERLLVSQGFSAEGWRCSCGALTTVGRRCPTCSSEMHHVPDIVEVAVDEALARDTRVELCLNADLDVLGRVGAFTHY